VWLIINENLLGERLPLEGFSYAFIISHFLGVRYKHCMFGCDWSIFTDTLLEEQSKFSASSRLLLEIFS
jgi:hypothetical protein